MSQVANIHVSEYINYEDTDHVLIDVREVYEFNDGRMPGAINIPLSQFVARYKEIPQNTVVLLVCRSGGRSFQAAQYLAMQPENYTELINLDGGTVDWARAGNPIERESK